MLNTSLNAWRQINKYATSLFTLVLSQDENEHKSNHIQLPLENLFKYIIVVIQCDLNIFTRATRCDIHNNQFR